jgi:hypothetical protein
MPTTNNNWPTPVATDLVKDGWEAIKDLGDAIDTSLGVYYPGKVLQVVRATDTTGRTTTSTSFVDASISVTITPKKNTSAILLIYTALIEYAGSNNFVVTRITDNSATPISGAQESIFGAASTTDPNSYQTLIAYATPATTSAVTYKVQFKKNSATAGTASIRNTVSTGQLFAIEVAA